MLVVMRSGVGVEVLEECDGCGRWLPSSGDGVRHRRWVVMCADMAVRRRWQRSGRDGSVAMVQFGMLAAGQRRLWLDD